MAKQPPMGRHNFSSRAMFGTKPAPVAPYGQLIRNKTSSQGVGFDVRFVATRAQLGSSTGNGVPTAGFEACEVDPQALQPHWGSKMIGDVLHGVSPDLSSEKLVGHARETVTASVERLRSLTDTIDGAGSLGELKSRISSSINLELPALPSAPSFELPSPGLPSLPSLPSISPEEASQRTSIVTHAADIANNTYKKAYESTQNVIADRVDRLGSDVASLASKNIKDVTPDSVQRAAMSVVDDLHAIKGAIDDHTLVFLPTLRDAVHALTQDAQLHSHFGTELLVAISKATAADAIVLLSELGRFIGIGNALALIVDLL